MRNDYEKGVQVWVFEAPATLPAELKDALWGFRNQAASIENRMKCLLSSCISLMIRLSKSLRVSLVGLV